MTIHLRKNARIRRHKRARSRVRGTALRPRLVVFRSNKHLYVQLVDDETGSVLAAASDRKTAQGQKGVERAKALGEEIARAAKKKRIEKLVFDRGGYKYHGNVKVLADAVREQGISF